MLNRGDKIGIVCCSNGQKQYYADKIKSLETTLREMGLQPVFSAYIYERMCSAGQPRNGRML